MKTVTALLTLLAAAPACAQDEFVGARLREWYARLNGDVFAQEEGLPAQTVDLDSELGLGDAEFAHELQAYLRLPVIGIFTLGGWTTGYKGDEVLSETFTFGDVTFTAGTQVKTELELSVVYLNYEYDFSFSLGELVKLEVGPLVGVRWMFARTSIESSLVSAEEEGSGGLPVVGVHSALQITRWLRADAEVLGLAFQAAERGAFYIEAYGEVVAQLGPLFAGVGYKYAQLEIEDHSTSVEFEADITMDGIYLTAGVRF
jgi:hypothetical protein